MGLFRSRTNWFFETIRVRNRSRDEPAASGQPRDELAGDPRLVTARALGVIHGPVFVRDSIGPDDTDHYFAFTFDAPGTLVVTLSTESAVAGLQVVRGVRTGGAIDPGEVLSTSSTLVENPVTVRRPLDAGSHFVRVYHIAFGDPSYDLTLAVGLQRDDQVPDSAGALLPLARPTKPRRGQHASPLSVAGMASPGRILDEVAE